MVCWGEARKSHRISLFPFDEKYFHIKINIYGDIAKVQLFSTYDYSTLEALRTLGERLECLSVSSPQ